MSIIQAILLFNLLFFSKEFKTDFAFSITSLGTPANLAASIP